MSPGSGAELPEGMTRYWNTVSISLLEEKKNGWLFPMWWRQSRTNLMTSACRFWVAKKVRKTIWASSFSIMQCCIRISCVEYPSHIHDTFYPSCNFSISDELSDERRSHIWGLRIMAESQANYHPTISDVPRPSPSPSEESLIPSLIHSQSTSIPSSIPRIQFNKYVWNHTCIYSWSSCSNVSLLPSHRRKWLRLLLRHILKN